MEENTYHCSYYVLLKMDLSVTVTPVYRPHCVRSVLTTSVKILPDKDLYSPRNDPAPEMIPNPEMIPKSTLK